MTQHWLLPAMFPLSRLPRLPSALHFPWNSALFCRLQDSHSLYMVMEVVQGGEFFTYLQVGGWASGWAFSLEEAWMDTCTDSPSPPSS